MLIARCPWDHRIRSFAASADSAAPAHLRPGGCAQWPPIGLLARDNRADPGCASEHQGRTPLVRPATSNPRVACMRSNGPRPEGRLSFFLSTVKICQLHQTTIAQRLPTNSLGTPHSKTTCVNSCVSPSAKISTDSTIGRPSPSSAQMPRAGRRWSHANPACCRPARVAGDRR